MSARAGIDAAEILIVEDEVFVLLDIVDRVERLGYGVYGVAGSVDQANRLIEKSLPHGALLDVKLGNRSVAPIARRLHRQDVPCLLLTGYSRRRIADPALAELPTLQKPFTDHALAWALDPLVR